MTEQSPFSEQQKLCVTVAFLLGTPWKTCEIMYPEGFPIYEQLSKQYICHTVHALCGLRTEIMLHLEQTSYDMQTKLENLSTLPWTKDFAAILKKYDISIERSHNDAVRYVIEINKMISDRLNSVREFFPDWIDWTYIKNLFTMPKGSTKKGVIAETKKFKRGRTFYPYTRYINWTPRPAGNILISDYKFVKILYDINHDKFDDPSKVRTISDTVTTNIYDFIDKGSNIRIMVDCENSDALKLASVLSQLEPEEIQKVDKIILYDDRNTTDIWSFLPTITTIPIEHVIVERLNTHKSLVDIKMSVGITKACYTENVDSFILFSSDSDFWGVIESVPEAKFLVMAEKEKFGKDTARTFENSDIYYCFMDDFCSGNISHFKNSIITATINKQLQSLIDVNIQEMLDKTYENLRIEMSAAEKQNFYDKFVKKAKLNINENRFTIEIPT